MKATIYTLFACLLISACQPKTQPIEYAFSDLYLNIAKSDYAAIHANLSAESRAYLDAITDPANHNVDRMIEIGNQYHVPYATMKYYISRAEDLEAQAEVSSYFDYLSLERVGFFDLSKYYTAVRDKIRHNSPKHFVGITYKHQSGDNRITWVEFEDAGDELDFHLLYTLRLYNSQLKTLYAAERRELGDISQIEWMEHLYKYVRPTYVDDKLIATVAKERKEIRQAIMRQ